MSKLTFSQAIIKGSFPAVFVVAQDETQVLLDLKAAFDARVARARKKKINVEISAKVHNLSWGVRSLAETIDTWNKPLDTPDPNTIALSRALSALYNTATAPGSSEATGTKSVVEFLIILDCDHHFDPRNQDVQVVRRIKNILELSARSNNNNRFLIFVGKSAVLPPSFADMVVVVDSEPPTSEEMLPVVKMLTLATSVVADPEKLLKDFEGFSIPQLKQTFRHQLILTKKGDPFDPSVFRKMKEETLKTSGGLVNLIHPSPTETFDALGGMSRYKEWAKLVQPSWTEEGRVYGLEPPKGVLLTGVYGCIAEGSPIFYRRGKRASSGSRKLPIEVFYKKFNGIPVSGKGISLKWVEGVPTFLQSADTGSGRILYNRVKAVRKTGRKECFSLRTEDGSSLELTADHPLLTVDRGFLPVSDLAVGDCLLTRSSMKLRRTRENHKKVHAKRTVVEGLKYHPDAWKKYVVEKNSGVKYEYGRTTKARLVVEAQMNGIPYEDYIHALKTDAGRSASFTFLGKDVCVYHIDEDPMNDSVENLMVFTHSEHIEKHWEGQPDHKFRDVFSESRVVSITPVGLRDTYDIEMEEPYPNFVVNNKFIAHNCGKSQSVKGLAQLWNLPILQFEMGKLRSGLIGSSEKNLYASLKLIEGFGDCIVWVDEAEKSLSGSASSNATDGGVGLRMLGILSTWMQETKNRVCFVMTANGVSTLPPEFVNRLDERFFFDIPSGQDMIDVISILISRNGWDPKSYDVYKLSVAGDRLVPREIEQTLKHAKMLAFSKGLPSPSQEILAEVLASKTRILDTMEKQVQEIRDWVGYDPERDEGRNARLAAPRVTQGGKTLFKEL